MTALVPRRSPSEKGGATFLAAQGQRLLKDGKTIKAAEDNLAELTQQARGFVEKQMPILKALQVV